MYTVIQTTVTMTPRLEHHHTMTTPDAGPTLTADDGDDYDEELAAYRNMTKAEQDAYDGLTVEELTDRNMTGHELDDDSDADMARPVGARVTRADGARDDVPAYWRADGYMSATRPLDAAEVYAVCVRVGRVNGPAALFDLRAQNLVDDDTLGAVIGDVWDDAEYPARDVAPDYWRAWFRTVGVRNAAGDLVDAPDGLQVFRGADAVEAQTGRYGMSWTTDRRTAEWFITEHIHRHPDNPVVYSTVAPAAAVLADLRDSERNEHEIVLDPDLLDPASITVSPVHPTD